VYAKESMRAKVFRGIIRIRGHYLSDNPYFDFIEYLSRRVILRSGHIYQYQWVTCQYTIS
jgi:hypothetical protein